MPTRAALLAASAALFVGAALAGCTDPARPAVSTSPTPEPGTATTSPQAHPDFSARARATVATMSDTDLVGQVLMPSVQLSDSPAAVSALVRTYHLGGVVIMGNVEVTTAEATAAQVRSLTNAVRASAQPQGMQLVPLIGTDQEYGWVTRIKNGVVQLPAAMAFGAAARPDLTEAAWRAAGEELDAVGINVDFAPDADVLGSPGNVVIGSRSYGSDATAVAAQVAAAVTGLEAAGIAATIKHFPGHGHTTVDSHAALPILGQSLASLNSGDLPPFQAGIDAGASLVMSGHLDVHAIDPGLPASFSDKVLIDLLRTKLKFTGVVVTDALNMAPAMRWAPGESAVRAFLAGNDVLLMPVDLGAVQMALLDALASGRVPRARMLESVTRIVALKLRLDSQPAADPDALNAPEHRAAAMAVAAAAVTVLKGSCTGALVTGPVSVTASAGRSQQVAWLSDGLRALGVTVVTSGGAQVHLVGYADGPEDLAEGAVVTVAMDSPYLLGSATSPVRVATYSSTQASMVALAAVLAGAAKPVGRSPVTVAGLPRTSCSG